MFDYSAGFIWRLGDSVFSRHYWSSNLKSEIIGFFALPCVDVKTIWICNRLSFGIMRINARSYEFKIMLSGAHIIRGLENCPINTISPQKLVVVCESRFRVTSQMVRANVWYGSNSGYKVWGHLSSLNHLCRFGSPDFTFKRFVMKVQNDRS